MEIPGLNKFKKYFNGISIDLVDSVRKIYPLETAQSLKDLRVMKRYVLDELNSTNLQIFNLEEQISSLQSTLAALGSKEIGEEEQKQIANLERGMGELYQEIDYLNERASRFNRTLRQLNRVRRDVLQARQAVMAFKQATGVKKVPTNPTALATAAVKISTGLSQLERIPFGIGDALAEVMDKLGVWLFAVVIGVVLCCCFFIGILLASYNTVDNMTVWEKFALGIKCRGDTTCMAEEVVIETYEESTVNISAGEEEEI